MDETYGTYVDDECLTFMIHDYDDDTDHDTDEETDYNTDDDTDGDTYDDTNDDTDDDDTDDGGRGNLYTIKVSRGQVCVPKIGSRS